MNSLTLSFNEPSEKPYEVLVVDDDVSQLALQVEILQEIPCHITTADSAHKALQLIREHHYDLVLLDKRLPDLDGDQVCRRIRQEYNDHVLPVIMVTGAGTPENLRHSLSMGATDFIKKPYDPVELLSRARSALERKQLLGQLDDAASVLFALAKMVEARDPTTGEHCRRLVHTCGVLADELGLSDEEREALQKGAVLHDIGKIAIPDAILLKPEKLTAKEWEVMRQHVEIGAGLCEHLNSVRDAVPVIRHHHECWDGSGYPDGLAGKQIPLIARVFQYADIYDALRHRRIYRGALPVSEISLIVEDEIKRGHRDPHIGEVFLGILEETPERLDNF